MPPHWSGVFGSNVTTISVAPTNSRWNCGFSFLMLEIPFLGWLAGNRGALIDRCIADLGSVAFLLLGTRCAFWIAAADVIAVGQSDAFSSGCERNSASDYSRVLRTILLLLHGSERLRPSALAMARTPTPLKFGKIPRRRKSRRCGCFLSLMATLPQLRWVHRLLFRRSRSLIESSVNPTRRTMMIASKMVHVFRSGTRGSFLLCFHLLPLAGFTLDSVIPFCQLFRSLSF